MAHSDRPPQAELRRIGEGVVLRIGALDRVHNLAVGKVVYAVVFREFNCFCLVEPQGDTPASVAYVLLMALHTIPPNAT